MIYKKLGDRRLKEAGIDEKIIDYSNDGILKVYDELFKKYGEINSSYTHNCENGTSINKCGEETFTDKITICNISEHNYKFVRLKTAEEIYSKEEYKKIVGMKKLSYGNHGLSITPPFPDHNLLFASIDLGSG